MPSAATVGPRGKASSFDPSADGIEKGEGGRGDSWRYAPARAPRPDDRNPLSQKRVFSATGTQGRRAAMRTGMFDEVDRSKHVNINPTATATTAGLRGALGVGAMGEAAAKAVIGRMMRNRRNRLGSRPPSTTRVRRKSAGNRTRTAKGRAQPDRVIRPGAVNPAGVKHDGGPLHRNSKKAAGGKGGDEDPSNTNTYSSGGRFGQKAVGGVNRGALGVGRRRENRDRRGAKGVAASGFEQTVFKAVLSSMANDRLRSGLHEIQANPRDLLRCEFVDIEPSRHGSTALGCHLMKGWVELKTGSQRRVSEYTAQCYAVCIVFTKSKPAYGFDVTWQLRT